MLYPGRSAESDARRGEEGERPGRFRLGVASDLHIMAASDGELRGVNVRDNASRVFAHIEDLATAGELDLLLLNGDISHDGSVDSYLYVKSRLVSIPVPCLVTPGNHDTDGPFSSEFGTLPKTVTLGRSHVLHLLDSRVPGQEHGQLTKLAYRFLGHALSEPTLTHIIALHHDVLQVASLRRPGLPNEDVAELLSALADSRAGGIVVLSGHRHRFAQVALGRFLFLTTGAVSCQFDFTQEGPVVTSGDPEFVILDLDDQLDYDIMCRRVVLADS